ncbi:MAG TPA: hypothetical protein VHB98_22240 [Chloroflexota bacterium]|nr:hypothetical protein [Chloroflexota bacterium]
MRSKLIAFSIAIIMLIGVVAPTAGVQAHAASAPARVAAVSGHVVDRVAPSRAAFFDKTRFLLHMGAAFYAFHHFVWARYKSGGFDSGASGRTGNFIKAGIALLFTYHELKKAYGIANSSSSKTLQLLVAPLNKLLGLVNTEAGKLKSGNYNSSDITGINDAITGLGKTAGSNGYNIKDLTVPVPGAS